MLHGGRAVRGLASLRGEHPGCDRGACWWRSGQVIMGRALGAGSPVTRQRIRRIDRSATRQRGAARVIMGRAAGPGCPVRPGGKRGRCRWVLGDHGACAQGPDARSTWQRILQLTEGTRQLVEGGQGDHRACGSGPECPLRRQRISRIGGTATCAGGGRCQVIMGRAVGAGYALVRQRILESTDGARVGGRAARVIIGRAARGQNTRYAGNGIPESAAARALVE